MAVFVQDDANASTSASSLAVAFTSNVTAGNAIFVSIRCSDTITISSVVDTLSHTYVETVTLSGNNNKTSLYRVVNISGGANTVTVTFSGASSCAVTVSEFSGIATSAELDQTNSNTGATATSGDHGSITTTVANGLLISTMGFDGNSGTVTPTSGWTALALPPAGGRLFAQYKVTTATETTSGAITWVTSRPWTGVIANCKDVSGGGGATWPGWYGSSAGWF